MATTLLDALRSLNTSTIDTKKSDQPPASDKKPNDVSFKDVFIHLQESFMEKDGSQLLDLTQSTSFSKTQKNDLSYKKETQKEAPEKNQGHQDNVEKASQNDFKTKKFQIKKRMYRGSLPTKK